MSTNTTNIATRPALFQMIEAVGESTIEVNIDGLEALHAYFRYRTRNDASVDIELVNIDPSTMRP